MIIIENNSGKSYLFCEITKGERGTGCVFINEKSNSIDTNNWYKNDSNYYFVIDGQQHNTESIKKGTKYNMKENENSTVTINEDGTILINYEMVYNRPKITSVVLFIFLLFILFIIIYNRDILLLNFSNLIRGIYVQSRF